MSRTTNFHLVFNIFLIISGATLLQCTTLEHQDHNAVNDKDNLHNASLLNNTHEGAGGNHSEDHSHSGVHLASWNFRRVSAPLLLSVILIMAGFLKLVFHYAECLSSIIPESCLLIVFGIAVGAILHADASPDNVKLEPDVFMLYLLPPIVLDSAYSLNDRVVFQNLGAILLYAVVGTIINFLMIGPALWGLSLIGAMGQFNISLVQCLLFSSFIVAVDPVAVLAIFQEIGVNNKLYFLVFGESLLNDAVTVVLYNMMLAFNNVAAITWDQILIGIGSFFTVSLGACLIGFVFGVISALATRVTSHVRVVEPLAVLMIAYMSYLFAELFHWSGIISLIICGLMQAEYSQHNISRKSYITVKYFIKMLSATSDTVIFVFLGLEVVRTTHQWHTGFVLWALSLCLLARLITVLVLTLCVNSRHKVISFKEQFIMWYGGLRGAVCFALCATISDDFQHKHVFLTTTMVIIFFTVFIQGITIKPFVNCCNIALAEEKENGVALEFNSYVVDHLMAATEALAGQQGDNYLRAVFERLNNKYFRKWLQSNPMTQDQRLLQTYHKMALKDHQRHIYEATHKEVGIKTGDEMEEPESTDIYMADEKPAEKKPSVAVISRILHGGQQDKHVSTTPGDGMAKLRWALAKTALLTTTTHYDRNLTHEDEEDFGAKLREKHQRIEHNHYLRQNHPNAVQNPAMSGQNEQAKSGKTAGNNHAKSEKTGDNNHAKSGKTGDNNHAKSEKTGDNNLAKSGKTAAADNNLNGNNSTESNVKPAKEPQKRLADLFGKPKGKMDIFTVAKMLKQKQDIETVNIVVESSDSSDRTSACPTNSERSFHTARTDLDLPVTNIDNVEIGSQSRLQAPSQSPSRHSDPPRSPRTRSLQGVTNKGFVAGDKGSEEVTEL